MIKDAKKPNNANKNQSEMILVSKEKLAEYEKLLEENSQLIEQKNKRIKQQSSLINELYEKLRLQRHRQFAPKSEKDSNPHQLSLFDEAVEPEASQEVKEADESITIPAHERKTKKKGRKPLPEDLPRITKTYDLPEAEKTCSCGCTLTCIGEVASEQLEIIPAKVHVLRHIRKKYACRGCENTVKEAKLPAQPISKSIASPKLLSHVCIAKYEDHLPLYRQERMLQRVGVDIARSTLSHWVLRCGDLLSPLYNLLQEHIQDYPVASADETVVQVLKEPDRPAQRKSYMWAFTGGPPNRLAILYHYNPSRGHEVLEDYLGDFNGYLHCDGHVAYQTYVGKPERDVTLVGCWYHVRRKFVEAQKVSNKSGLSDQMIRMIKQLSKIESEGQSLTDEGRRLLRQRKAKPILNKIKKWLEQYMPQVVPNSILGKAMKYARNQWNRLNIYIKDGRLEISNNHTERAIKPFVIGRKNWMFSTSIEGARAGSIIYSLIETCKANGIPTYEYLAYVYEQLPLAKQVEDFEALLPFNVDKSKLLG